MYINFSPRENNPTPSPHWQIIDAFGIERSHLQKAAAISEAAKKQEQFSDLGDLIEKAEKGSLDAQLEVADYYVQNDLPEQPRKAYFQLVESQNSIEAAEQLAMPMKEASV